MEVKRKHSNCNHVFRVCSVIEINICYIQRNYYIVLGIFVFIEFFSFVYYIHLIFLDKRLTILNT